MTVNHAIDNITQTNYNLCCSEVVFKLREEINEKYI